MIDFSDVHFCPLCGDDMTSWYEYLLTKQHKPIRLCKPCTVLSKAVHDNYDTVQRLVALEENPRLGLGKIRYCAFTHNDNPYSILLCRTENDIDFQCLNKQGIEDYTVAFEFNIKTMELNDEEGSIKNLKLHGVNINPHVTYKDFYNRILKAAMDDEVVTDSYIEVLLK